MTQHYEPIAAPRFDVEQTPDGERVRIRPRRQIFPMVFLPIWLVLWTLGGLFSLAAIPGDVSPYTVVFLGFWAVGLVLVIVSFVWLLVGSETLAVIAGDLEVVHGGLGLSRRWVYEGAQIQNLQVAERPAWVARRSTLPFRANTAGSVKFDYGARTIYLAPGLEDAEGAMIVERLASQLPAAARG